MNHQLFANVGQAEQYLKQELGSEESFDVCVKKIYIRNMQVIIAYISGLIDNETLGQILASLQFEDEQLKTDELQYFAMHFNYQGKSEVKDRQELLLAILSGRVVFVTPSGYCYMAEMRNYPARSPEEPDNEKVIRGARDGFTESINANTALIRRRIRNKKLRFQLHQISTLGQTDVAVAYMDGIASDENIKWLKERLEQIQHDGLTMTDKSLEEWLFKQRFHPFPFVRYSERPDIVAAHLLEGHIAILVDTSPSVILVPVTVFHMLQHAEEYRQAPIIGTMMRVLRYIAVVWSFLLLPLWYLFAAHPQYLPSQLSFIGLQEKGEIPLFLQIIFADVGIEFLRIAAIHTPSPLATAMGLIAGIMIGQIAIDVGLFASEVVLYAAISALFTFAIPNYELSISVKLFRFILLAATALAGANGFFIVLVVLVLYGSALKPMNVPYFWPLIPFFPKAFSRVIIRFPMTDDVKRPFIVHAKQRKRS